MSSDNNVIQLPLAAGEKNIKDGNVSEMIIDSDYFGYAQTINITELLQKMKELQKNNKESG